MSNVLTGRIGLSPTMIGRASALDRVRSVVEQADSRCSDLPSGRAGRRRGRHRQDPPGARDARRSAGRRAGVLRRRRAWLAGPLVRPRPRSWRRPVRRIPPARRWPPSDAAAAAGGAVVVVEDLHWIDVDSAAFIDDVARQAVADVGHHRHVPIVRPPSRCARRRSGAAARAAQRGRAHPPRSAEPQRGRGDDDRHRRPAGVVGGDRGRHSPQRRRAVRRRRAACAAPTSIGAATTSSTSQLPWSLEEAVRQQLADLTPSERVLIDALAVFAQPAGFEVLTAITGLDEDQLLGQLRGLVERGVIVEPRDDRLWFGHALVADSVLHQLLGSRAPTSARALLRDPRPRRARRLRRPGAPRPWRRSLRRDHRHRGPRCARVPRPRFVVPGAAAGVRRPGRGRRATRTCSRWPRRLRGASTSSARRSDHAHRWLELATDGRSRIDAMRYVSRSALRARRPGGQRRGDRSADRRGRTAGGVARCRRDRHHRRHRSCRGRHRPAEDVAPRPDAVDVGRAGHRARPRRRRRMGRGAGHGRAGERAAGALRPSRRAGGAARGDRGCHRTGRRRAAQPSAEQHDGARPADVRHRARQLRQQLRDTATASGFDKLGRAAGGVVGRAGGAVRGRPRRVPAAARGVAVVAPVGQPPVRCCRPSWCRCTSRRGVSPTPAS